MENSEQADEIVFARTISTLLALAALADRVANAPRLMRRLVLWFLRRGEDLAREAVFSRASARGVRALPEELFEQPKGWNAQEARRIALSFRAMAWALSHLDALKDGKLPPEDWRQNHARAGFQSLDRAADLRCGPSQICLIRRYLLAPLAAIDSS